MQVSAISQSQQQNKHSFQGRVDIVNDLSYLPCKYVRKAYDSMSKMIEDKPFDLFIFQDYKLGNLKFVAQKTEHLGKKNKPLIKYQIGNAQYADNGHNTSDLYISVAKHTIEDYSKAYPEVSAGDKIKRFVSSLYKTFRIL